MDIKEKKAFKRLLKELGIFHIWIKNRKQYGNGNCSIQLFWQLPNKFARLIDESFTWSGTGQEWLWEELYDSSAANYLPSEILQDECLMTELKEICNYHL